jgi:hypothetical protein
MDAKDWVGVASATLSVIAITISWTISRLNARASIRPVLVFEYPPDEGWKVKNIGSGPALNVLIAQREHGKWINPVRVPPMSKDGSLTLTWCLHDNVRGLGALYEDVDGRKYTTTCGNDLSRVFVGHSFGPWGEDNIGKHFAEGRIVPPVSKP